MNDNTNQLFDLISNIQAKLNSNDDNNSSPNDSSSQSTKNNETSSYTNGKNEEKDSERIISNGNGYEHVGFYDSGAGSGWRCTGSMGKKFIL